MECLQCGKEHNNKKFCSRLCQKQYAIKLATEASLIKKGGRLKTKKCLYCGKEFMPQRNDVLYCSKSCAGKVKVVKQKRLAAKKIKNNYDAIVNYIDNLNSARDFNLNNLCSLLNVKTRSSIDGVLREYNTNIRSLFINKFGDGHYKHITTAETVFKKVDKILGVCGEREKTFYDLLSENNNRLRVDWYSKKYNLIIEYNGKQHYEPIYGQEMFEITKVRESIRLQYCKEKDVNFLVIPYFYDKPLEDLLSPFLQKNMYSVVKQIANQQPSSENLQYSKVSEKVQRLIGEEAKPINLTRVPELQFIGV